MIAERTRDKIAASRRKGKWTGGPVPFGYSAKDKKLVVNEAEAQIVREAFTLFLAHRQMAVVARELNKRGLLPRTSKRVRACFRRLRSLRDRVRDADPELIGEGGLSMGMSGDFETAIACGATHVRVGSAIFGARNYG